jgi:protein SCO1/2
MSRHEERRSRKQPPAWRFWAIVLSGLAAIVPLYTMALLKSARHAAPVTTFTGLTDADGQVLQAGAFDDRYKLVFFGFTRCAAVCPLTLVKVRSILGTMGPRSAALAPLFISLDPEHDQPGVLKAYTGAIDPRIVGITGDAKRVDEMVQAFGAVIVRHPGARGPYALDHSARLYLIGPDNRLLSSYESDESASEIASDIAQWLRS